jgi:putative cofactor-binding repeat protein
MASTSAYISLQYNEHIPYNAGRRSKTLSITFTSASTAGIRPLKGVNMKTAIVFVAVLFMPALAFSATIYVPDDYPTIQAAIDASSDGDLILVDPGTYSENIRYYGKAITIKSDQGPWVTVIEGIKQFGSTVQFIDGENRFSMIEGFTITHNYDFPRKDGHGIYCVDGSPTIRGNIIRKNALSYVFEGSGAGIYLENSNSVVDGNLIEENRIDGAANYD